MGKDEKKLVPDSEKQLNQDVSFLLSSIRARQNGLIFFLERFNSRSMDQCMPEEYKVYKNQFLQKQKIYTAQIRAIVEKYSLLLRSNDLNLLKQFWIKLKSIIKVSMERVNLMDLLEEGLKQRYEQILSVIQRNYNDLKGIKQFVEIQYLIKKRTIESLVASKSHVGPSSDSKIAKNRSETLFKQDSIQSEVLHPFELKFHQKGGTSDNNRPHENLKSLSRYKNRKDSSQKLKKHKLSEKDHRKFQVNLQKHEKNISGVLDARIDYVLDKKKSIYENVYSLYDNLFARNISNHKIISKFIFSSGKISKIKFQLNHQNRKQKEKELKNSSANQFIRYSSKVVKRNQHEISETLPINKPLVGEQEKKKNARPKTSKNAKIMAKANFNNKLEKIRETIKAS